MVTKGRSEKELWKALESLDDDLFDPKVPEAVLDEELKSMGVDPAALAKRSAEFVANLKEEERLSWQARARARRAELQARASRAVSKVPVDMNRRAILARLDELRATDPNMGTAIKIAARKRKPEESTDEELRALLEEMEALQAIEDDETE